MITNYDSLVKATVKVSNSNDTTCEYSITAEIVIVGENIESFSGGIVKKGETSVANFSCYSSNSFNFSSHGVSSEESQLIHSNIDLFINSMKEYVVTNKITL